MPISGDPVLEICGVSSGYGGMQVLADVDCQIQPGRALAVLGANGVGKSTLLRTVAGLLCPYSGDVLLAGRSIVGSAPHKIARLGMTLVPEGRALFPDMTVEDNLRVGTWVAGKTKKDVDVEGSLSDFPILKEKLRARAGSLSGGQQQLLAVARALVARPRVLLLDEPSLGLSPRAVGELFDVLAVKVADGLAVLVAEQDAPAAMRVADHALVLRGGRVVARPSADELGDRDALRNLYL